ncbi:MAG TPA: dihydrofolate reductase family protein [Vicinamibacteria bacterium]|nr:dihydrofolate reductase family protein [Vicinamibacteria bacterium]
MKLVVGTFLTLDGVMQAPGGPEEDRSGGFEHGGWSVSYFDDVMSRVMTDWVEKADGLLLGRRTYEIFAAYWPHVTGDDPTTVKLNEVRKHVASRTLKRPEWNNSSVIQGDAVQAIRKLKGEPGDELQVHGSGDLIQTLLEAGLIDTFRLWIFPVVLGQGKRLFAGGAVPSRFELAETRTSSTGVVLQVLHAAGSPTYGSFALEQPTPEEKERRRRNETGR